MSGFETDDLAELFAPCGKIRVKRMFGGHGVYADGLFFALTFDGDIYLKADAVNEPRFIAEDLPPFLYLPGNGRKPVTLSYRRMPETCFDDPETLRDWCSGAIAAARRAARKQLAKPTKTGIFSHQ